MCAAITSSGVDPSLEDVEEVAVATNLAGNAGFKAIVAGRKTPTVHAPPTAADSEMWIKALWQAGMTKRQLSLLQHPEQMAAAPAEEVCALGIMLKRVFAGLPEDVANRLHADNPLRTAAGARPAPPRIMPRQVSAQSLPDRP